jgi:hypothetical protein
LLWEITLYNQKRKFIFLVPSKCQRTTGYRYAVSFNGVVFKPPPNTAMQLGKQMPIIL